MTGQTRQQRTVRISHQKGPTPRNIQRAQKYVVAMAEIFFCDCFFLWQVSAAEAAQEKWQKSQLQSALEMEKRGASAHRKILAHRLELVGTHFMISGDDGGDTAAL